jgi:DNA-binding IclR family transcriptional regulator
MSNYNRFLCDQINYNDLWATATGIILLAYLPDKELLKILKNKPEQTLLDIAAGTLKPLDFFKNIRQKEKFCYNGDAHRLAIAAFPVFKNGQFIAALGASAPAEDFTEKHKDFILRKLKSAIVQKYFYADHFRFSISISMKRALPFM